MMGGGGGGADNSSVTVRASPSSEIFHRGRGKIYFKLRRPKISTI